MMGMAVDVERRRPCLSTVTGGLSGPAVRPVAVRMVWQTAKAVKIPVIGLGGIASGRDALEFIKSKIIYYDINSKFSPKIDNLYEKQSIILLIKFNVKSWRWNEKRPVARCGAGRQKGLGWLQKADTWRDRTLIVKLSPNVTDIAEIARAVESEGAEAVSLIRLFRVCRKFYV